MKDLEPLPLVVPRNERKFDPNNIKNEDGTFKKNGDVAAIAIHLKMIEQTPNFDDKNILTHNCKNYH